jgi:hypothetical protein
MNKWFLIILLSTIICSSCNTGKTFSTRYYLENKDSLDGIAKQYKILNAQKQFSIEFKDKEFSNISFEILSDTFRYIYNFYLNGPALSDTLTKFHYDANAVMDLINDMRVMRCTWINNMEYYENTERKNLVFLSLRNRRKESLLQGEKYYALAFFNEPQRFDRQGRLVDKTERTRTRIINGEIFRKITERVCYAITGSFR